MQAEKKAYQLIKITEYPSFCATSCLGKLSQFEPCNVESLSKEDRKPSVGVRKAKQCSKCHMLLTICNKDMCKLKKKNRKTAIPCISEKCFFSGQASWEYTNNHKRISILSKWIWRYSKFLPPRCTVSNLK